MKLAYLAHPQPYGIYTVCRHLRVGLAPHGHEVRWLGVNPAAEEELKEARWAGELQYGDLIPWRGDNEAQFGKRVREHLMREKYDGLFINCMSIPLELNLARYFPQEFLRIIIVHAMATGT